MIEQDDCCGMQEGIDPAPWWKRALRFLLQAYGKHHEVKDPNAVIVRQTFPYGAGRIACGIPGMVSIHAKDAIFNKIEVHFSILEKLRLLCGCTAQISVITYTENLPGALKTDTLAYVDLP